MLTLDKLSDSQRDYFLRWANEKQSTPEALLSEFRPDPWMPGSIIGVLPHCGLFGLMEPDGRCHT